jgi:hypothetical protein
MHSLTTLLPLLALAASVLAIPTPARLDDRGRPNLHEVIRNPTPIDAGVSAHLDPLHNLLPLLPKLNIDLGIHRRAAPVLKEEAAPVFVIDRSA